jgi:CBS domain-containing protein
MANLELKAKDIMSTNLLTFKKNTPVKEAAEKLAERNISGAPVVDDKGNLIGIVTDSDLIMPDVRFHFPTYIELLDGYIYLPSSLERFEEEFKKAIGAKVGDVMTADVITVDENTSVEDIATLMIEKDISRFPVMSDGKLVGIVTKIDIVKAISKS